MLVNARFCEAMLTSRCLCFYSSNLTSIVVVTVVMSTIQEAEGEDAAAEAVQAAGLKLYGRWQTDAWQPPVAEGGLVPKNEHGNVLCPPFAASLPKVRSVVVLWFADDAYREAS